MTCIVWENDGCKKVDLSVVEIGGAIEKEVAALDYEANESLYMAMVFTFLIATFPFLFRIYYSPRLRHIISDAIHRQVVGMDSLSETRGLLLGTTWQVIDTTHSSGTNYSASSPFSYARPNNRNSNGFLPSH